MNMRIGLDHHQFTHFDRAGFAHPAEIVSFKIDEHDVLRPFFWMTDQFA